MKTIYAKNRTVLPLGRCGENLTRQIVFDISNWESLYGIGTAELIYQRPTDERPYIMEITREKSLIHWLITAWHTAVGTTADTGYGKCELRYYVGDVLKKSEIWSTRVDPALDTPSETIPPSPEQGWVDQVLSAAGKAENTLTLAEGFANKSETASGQATDAVAQAKNSAVQTEQLMSQATNAATRAETAAVRAETAADRSEQNNTPAYQIGNGLKLSNNTLEVDTAQDFNDNNARPASAALVQTTAKTVETLSGSALLKSQIAQETGASAEKVMSQKAVTDAVNHYAIPDYWEEHLSDKINTIKELQRAGGKNSFSFIVITDPHYAQNLGKISPHLAKKILNECNIRYVLGLGDFQNRSPWATKDEAMAEWYGIQQMFAPIAENLLATQGNHDGSWGGPLSEATYPYNLTPETLYSLISAPTYQHQNAVTDESGSAYYVDDPTRKVRYITLNTHCNEYALNEDGSAKYNNMSHFRFTQSQYVFLINKALVLEDGWSVVVAAHAPVNNAYGKAFGDETNATGDHVIMRNLLKAFKNKTTYSGAWGGTAGGSVGSGGYTNLFDRNGDGFSDSGSKFFTNWMPYSSKGNGTAYHFKGLKSDSGYTNPYKMQFKTASGTTSAQVYCTNANVQAGEPADYDSSVKIVQHDTNTGDAAEATEYIYVQFEIREAVPDNLIITADENIVEATRVGEAGYDAVTVEADFTKSPGTLIGYFSGHMHADYHYKASDGWGVDIITTRCDSANENNTNLLNERIIGSITEQSFDVFTVNTKTHTINATKIGAGSDRTIYYQ